MMRPLNTIPFLSTIYVPNVGASIAPAQGRSTNSSAPSDLFAHAACGRIQGAAIFAPWSCSPLGPGCGEPPHGAGGASGGAGGGRRSARTALFDMEQGMASISSANEMKERIALDLALMSGVRDEIAYLDGLAMTINSSPESAPNLVAHDYLDVLCFMANALDGISLSGGPDNEEAAYAISRIFISATTMTSAMRKAGMLSIKELVTLADIQTIQAIKGALYLAGRPDPEQPGHPALLRAVLSFSNAAAVFEGASDTDRAGSVRRIMGDLKRQFGLPDDEKGWMTGEISRLLRHMIRAWRTDDENFKRSIEAFDMMMSHISEGLPALAPWAFAESGALLIEHGFKSMSEEHLRQSEELSKLLDETGVPPIKGPDRPN